MSGTGAGPPFRPPPNLVESASSDYLYEIEFRPDDLASRARRLGLTTFFQISISLTWLRDRPGLTPTGKKCPCRKEQ
jgi:hypothetical protein